MAADVSRKTSRSKERLQTKQSNSQQSEIEASESNNIMSTEVTIENLVWKDLNEEQIIELLALTPQELESKFAEIFSCYKYHICLKEACLLDFYVSTFWFAKQSKFTAEQISAFFSLVKILLESIEDEKVSMAKNICQMKKYIATCSNKEDAVRPSLFSVYQTKLISEYIMESLFQHHKLYVLLFSSQTTDEPVIKQKLLVEVPPMADVPFPPPLDEGLPEEIHNQHVLGQTNVDDVKELHVVTDGPEKLETDEIVDESDQHKQESLFSSLKPDEMKKVLKDVSDGVLSEVKNNVQKKLKERESTVLTKMAKK